ncbi:MAG TPA: LysM peptidoglycan-binding domain-containing protein [Anaerolineales bacterium]
MNTRKFLQMIALIALLLGTFASTGQALAAPACGTSYTVISGDTLRVIAAKCDTTVYALRRANPQIGSGDLIYPGQSLLLPGALFDDGNGRTIYIVSRGDTVKGLAARFNTTMDQLANWNPDITNINLIYEGQRLSVNGFAGTPIPPVPTGGSYVVQRGDTLRKIAARFDTSVAALLQVNPQIYNQNLIFTGQVINLPAGVSSYVVQYGDTLRIIANRFGTTVDNLLALNPGIYNPNWIFVGQTIRIW